MEFEEDEVSPANFEDFWTAKHDGGGDPGSPSWEISCGYAFSIEYEDGWWCMHGEAEGYADLVVVCDGLAALDGPFNDAMTAAHEVHRDDPRWMEVPDGVR